MITLTFDYTAEYGNKKVFYYLDKSCTQHNPTTLLKYYEGGSLVRVVLYDEESEVIANFSFSRGAYSMMTDSISGKHMKTKNIYKFMGVELVNESKA